MDQDKVNEISKAVAELKTKATEVESQISSGNVDSVDWNAVKDKLDAVSEHAEEFTGGASAKSSTKGVGLTDAGKQTGGAHSSATGTTTKPPQK